MLSFRFQLTPAQTKVLLCLYCGDYDRSEPNGPVLPNIDIGGHFVSTISRLIDKGLASHSNEREPTFLITKQGESIAELIIAEAEKIILSKERKPVEVVRREDYARR